MKNAWIISLLLMAEASIGTDTSSSFESELKPIEESTRDASINDSKEVACDATLGTWQIYDAVRVGNVAKIREVVTKDNVNLSYFTSRLLFTAVKGRSREKVKELIKIGALVNLYQNEDNDDRALHLAARLGFTDMVEILLESGADLNLLGAENKTVLGEAVDNRQFETAQFIVNWSERKMTIFSNKRDIELASKLKTLGYCTAVSCWKHSPCSVHTSNDH